MREHRGMDLQTIAQQLDADVLLTGWVRLGGGQIHLRVELVGPQDGMSLWTGDYTSDTSQVFAVQTELAEAIARELRIALEPSAALARQKSHVVDARAYDLYLRARDAAARHDTAEAIEFYELAIAEDEGFAEANAGLAEALYFGVLSGVQADDTGTEMRIQRAATRAAAADPDLPQAQLARGLASASLADALTHLRRAVQLDPSYAEGYHHIGNQIIELNPLLALRFFEKALELDPLLDLSLMTTVSAYALLDRFEEAEEAIARGRERWPDRLWWDIKLAQLQFDQRRYEAGVPLVQGATRFEVSPMPSVVYAGALRMLGQRTEAFGPVTEIAERFPSFCEGRAALAALTFDTGDRVAARNLANDIFEAAGRRDAGPALEPCAAMAAAGIRGPTRAAEWLRRIAAEEAALRAWILHFHGISSRMAFHREWFPWNNVAQSRAVVEAADRVEETITVLETEAGLVLDGILN